MFQHFSTGKLLCLYSTLLRLWTQWSCCLVSTWEGGESTGNSPSWPIRSWLPWLPCDGHTSKSWYWHSKNDRGHIAAMQISSSMYLLVDLVWILCSFLFGRKYSFWQHNTFLGNLRNNDIFTHCWGRCNKLHCTVIAIVDTEVWWNLQLLFDKPLRDNYLCQRRRWWWQTLVFYGGTWKLLSSCSTPSRRSIYHRQHSVWWVLWKCIHSHDNLSQQNKDWVCRMSTMQCSSKVWCCHFQKNETWLATCTVCSFPTKLWEWFVMTT